MAKKPENVLSIFIDESGDFGPYDPHDPYYLVSMVFHDQKTDISEEIHTFKSYIHTIVPQYDNYAIHTGPLIRRESVYKNDLMEDRKKLFNKLFNLARRLPINYICPVLLKTKQADEIAMTAALSKLIAKGLNDNREYIESFDKTIVYYDNGQIELTKILTSVFSTLFNDIEFRKVKPADYELFQIADLICTLELIGEKASNGSLSSSEMEFFESILKA